MRLGNHLNKLCMTYERFQMQNKNYLSLDNYKVVKAVVCAGLYPNVVKVHKGRNDNA